MTVFLKYFSVLLRIYLEKYSWIYISSETTPTFLDCYFPFWILSYWISIKLKSPLPPKTTNQTKKTSIITPTNINFPDLALLSLPFLLENLNFLAVVPMWSLISSVFSFLFLFFYLTLPHSVCFHLCTRAALDKVISNLPFLNSL